MNKTLALRTGLAALVLAGFATASQAQYAPPVYAPPVYAPPPAPVAYSQQDLDSMLAPIALYPDPVLSQVLVAATYPSEVIEASRWLRSNPGLGGEPAVRAASRTGWDPSVQSLCAFPQVLAMMEQYASWTESLGEAFLVNERAVMDTVQSLRQRAWAAGTLRSTPYASVYSQGTQIIIVPTQPQQVFIPYYDPLVAYGRWWHAVAPMRWGPWPGYVARGGAFYWGPGIAVSIGNFHARFDWPRYQVNVVRVNAPPRVWVHEPEHRHGEPYRVEVVRQRFGHEEPRRIEGRPERHIEKRPEPRREERHDERYEDRRGRERHGDARPAPRMAPVASAGGDRGESRHEPRSHGNGNANGHGNGNAKGHDKHDDRGRGEREHH
jgi:hypothetical protein